MQAKNRIRSQMLQANTSAWMAIGTIVLLGAAAVAPGCSDGKDGADAPPTLQPDTPTELQPSDNAPGVVIAIEDVTGASAVDGTFKVGDSISVKFTVKKKDGTDWKLSEMATGRILVSGPSLNYQPVIGEQSDLPTHAVDNGDGTFTYTFAQAIPATYPAPLNDTPTFGAADGELQGQALLGGTYTVGLYAYWNYTVDGLTYKDVGNTTADFRFGGTGAIAHRELVTQANCNKCHTDLRAHGGVRQDVTLCLLCHTKGAEDKNVPSVEGGTPDVTISFAAMIHKIHNGEHLPSVLGVGVNPDGSHDYGATPKPYKIVGHNDSVSDYSEVAFPVWPNLNIAMPRDQGYSLLSSTDPDGTGPLLSPKSRDDSIRTGVTGCLKCHGDPDGSGPLPAPVQGNVYKSQSSSQACGSCHDDIAWGGPYTSNGQTMPAQANDSNCILCHTASGDSLSVEDAHLHPLNNPSLNPGVNFIGSGMSGASGAGGRFLAGDKPAISFQVKDDAGTDIPLATLDSASAIVVGPTSNRQAVMPYTGPNNISISPYDFSGRLASGSTSGKGTLSRVLLTGTPVTEILTVEFSSATAFGVTGSVSGNLGGSALTASPSTNPSGSSISAIDLSSSAVAETVTVSFGTSTVFAVTGSVSGAMGTGQLPATTSASARFVSSNGALAFTVAVGTTAFSTGNNVYLVIFEGAAADPLLFAIVAGRTSFAATDRFYYEVVAPAASYTLKLPMELPTEYLGNGDNNVGQTLVAGNLPVYYGRQTLYEVTAVTPRTTLSAPANALDRFVDVGSTANFAVNDYCVLDGAAGVGAREYAQIGLVESATRMWFKTPIRYAHSASAPADEPTLTYRQEGAANRYTLTPATGVVTSVVAFGTGNAILMTYRTDGRFGYLRHNGDSLQSGFVPPINDTPSLGQDWAEWNGLPLLDGTYTASVWGYRNLNLALYGEVQTYRLASIGANEDCLYGAASTTIEPYAFISSSQNCYACHNDLIFHGGGRSGFDTCLLCHGLSGGEDWAQYNPPSTNPTAPNNAVTVSFRTMLHKIHRGEELANASTYAVYGNGASTNTYGEVAFPAMPDGVKNCTMCHGTANAWMQPSDRTHPLQTVPTQSWMAVCNACHDSDAATAHIGTMTSAGQEACAVCHGEGKEWNVELMHKVR